jgi:hypothetical protein
MRQSSGLLKFGFTITVCIWLCLYLLMLLATERFCAVCLNLMFLCLLQLVVPTFVASSCAFAVDLKDPLLWQVGICGLEFAFLFLVHGFIDPLRVHDFFVPFPCKCICLLGFLSMHLFLATLNINWYCCSSFESLPLQSWKTSDLPTAVNVHVYLFCAHWNCLH